MMFAAATDHVFLDGGHTIDFTNKAFEVLDHLGWDAAADVLPTLVPQTASAARSEERGAWRLPPRPGRPDRRRPASELPERLAAGLGLRRTASTRATAAAASPGWPGRSWPTTPPRWSAAINDAIAAGARPEELGRAVAYAAALRITRFHTQNDHGDWDEVHHAFTAANALHQALRRSPSPALLRGVYHGALRIYLDRFLNIPAARLPGPGRRRRPRPEPAGLLGPGGPGRRRRRHRLPPPDRRRRPRPGHRPPRPGPPHRGRRVPLVPDLRGGAVRQFHAWPPGSEEGALILTGTARFLAAHTPTRRELSQVVTIATRLRRGEALFEALRLSFGAMAPDFPD